MVHTEESLQYKGKKWRILFLSESSERKPLWVWANKNLRSKDNEENSLDWQTKIEKDSKKIRAYAIPKDKMEKAITELKSIALYYYIPKKDEKTGEEIETKRQIRFLDFDLSDNDQVKNIKIVYNLSIVDVKDNVDYGEESIYDEY